MSVPSPIAPLGELAYHPQAQVDFEDGDGTFLAFHKKLRKKKRNYKPFPLRWPFLISLLLLLLLCIALIGSALILMPNSDSNAVISTPALSSISKRRHGNNQRDGALSARSPDDDSEDESSEDERVGGKKVQNSKNKSTMLAKKPKIKSGRVKWTTTAQPNRHGVQPPVTLTTTQGETTTVDTTEETTIYEPGKTGGPGPGNRPVKIEPGKSPEETDETVSTLPTESPRPTMNPDEPPAQTPQKTASGITTTVLSPAPPTTPPSEEDPGKGLETEPIEASEETLPTATRGPHDQTSLPIIESDELSTTETAYPIKETEDVSLTTTPVEATKSANREADPPEVEPSTTVETPELLPSTAIFENPGQDDSSATPTTSQPQPAKEPPKMETKTTFAGEQTTKNEGKTETKGVVVVPHSSSTTGAAELPDEHIINTMPTGDPVAIAQFETTVVSAAEPYLIITETGGVLVTDFITPSPTSYVLTYASEIEPTQMSMITDEGQWITVTTIVVVRVGGTVTQVLETRPPMTILTVVNNDLTEMVITPRPTPRQLTLGGTPMTFTSVYMSFKALAVDGDFTPTDIWPVQVTTTDVFVGSFLPVFAAAVISLVLRIIDMNAKMFQPFCALAKRQGAASAETVTLNFWEARKSWTMPLRMALRGHVVPVLTTGLVAGSWLLVPLAAEAINVKVYGSCQHGDEEGCGWGLGVARPFTYAMMAVIIVMAAVVALLARIIGRWKTGLSWNPWSIAGITLLAMNPQFRAPLVVLPKGAAHGAIKQATLENVYGGRRYKFGTYKNTDGDEHYGIVPANECATGLMEKMASAQAERNHRAQPTGKTTTRMHVPFVPLKFWWRAAVLLVHAALLALIVYYEIGSLPYSNLFERFMDRPDTKQRLVWSAVGVSLAFWWFYFCSSVAAIMPYCKMLGRLQPPSRSILVTQSSNPFTSLASAVRSRYPYLALVSITSIMSELSPAILANMAFRRVGGQGVDVVCAHLSIALLSMMVLTLLASLFIKWPHMPADPRSVSGMTYYIAESTMLGLFEGLEDLDSAKRDQRIQEIGRRYGYGDCISASGRTSFRVDADGGIVGELAGNEVCEAEQSEWTQSRSTSPLSVDLSDTVSPLNDISLREMTGALNPSRRPSSYVSSATS